MVKPRLLIFVVAYFAESTIEKVLRRIPADLSKTYDVEILIIDDGSNDDTFRVGTRTQRTGNVPFSLTILYNPVNQGYGGNQKIGYHYAIEKKFDFVVLLHGDGQYAPEVLSTLVEPLRLGQAEAVLGSRMMSPYAALKGRMPLYKFIGNRILTAAQNRLLSMSLTEFHSGYRAYSVAALRKIPFERNANVFHFDTEIIIQLNIARQKIIEVPIPTYYGDEICRVNGIKYAKDVVKASLQARLQSINLFYDRRFDCAPKNDGNRYPSKLEFDSTHSRVVALVRHHSRVLDIGSGSGAVGAELKGSKGCTVVGCDMATGTFTNRYDQFFIRDLEEGLPALPDIKFDFILALDVVEHLHDPERFLDEVRALATKSDATVILTTANVGFALIRLGLLFGRFEYGKRGILDLTHTRLFTRNTLKRALQASGLETRSVEGVVVPVPFAMNAELMSRLLLKVNRFLARVWPTMFGFQLLAVCKARPTLGTLLAHAMNAADQKRSDYGLGSGTSGRGAAGGR